MSVSDKRSKVELLDLPLGILDEIIKKLPQPYEFSLTCKKLRNECLFVHENAVAKLYIRHSNAVIEFWSAKSGDIVNKRFTLANRDQDFHKNHVKHLTVILYGNEGYSKEAEENILNMIDRTRLSSLNFFCYGKIRVSFMHRLATFAGTFPKIILRIFFANNGESDDITEFAAKLKDAEFVPGLKRHP
uniref:F-box domain-containing protein n=1 Tax=Panagrolaimus sp. JU765 TaxID=591449 RepID=A0AC34RMJ0_9BILA